MCETLGPQVPTYKGRHTLETLDTIHASLHTFCVKTLINAYIKINLCFVSWSSTNKKKAEGHTTHWTLSNAED